MATTSELFDIKQKHLVGKLILSPVSKGRIVDIKMPESDSIVTVTADDTAGKSVKILEDYLPILANGFISYLGQPVIAVFGPDSETVDVFCSGVEIEVDSDEADFQEAFSKPILPFTWTSGNISKFFTKDATIVESEFTVDSQGEALSSDERILACFAEDGCHVKLASQWPLHVKDSVASVLGVTKLQVKIYPKHFRADFDQLLYMPSVYAAITAIAAKKAGCLAELFVSVASYQPKTKFTRSTVINSEGKPCAEKILVEADFGAYPLYVDEACRSILAGLIPSYDINAVEVVIQINKSATIPASFFGDLGYSTATAFTEYHFNKIAKVAGKSPYQWRCENLGKISLLSEKVRRCMTYEALQSCLDECATDSWFNRIYSVNSQGKFANQKVSPIAGYAKGIGLACAHGVGGFSEAHPYSAQNHLNLTLGDDGRVYVTIGFYVASDTLDNYKNIIHENLDVDPEKIFFTDLNADNVKDFGPNVLSRGACVVPKMLETACQQAAKRLKTGTKPPFTQQVFYTVEENRPFYDANTFGAIAIALHIDPVKLVPVVDNITARLKFGKVLNTTVLARRIRQTICTSIAHFCPCIENNYTIDLKVKSNPHLPTGSCNSMLRGITAAAFASAVCQALGHDVNKFPINDQDILSIVQMKKPQVQEEVNEA